MLLADLCAKVEVTKLPFEISCQDCYRLATELCKVPICCKSLVGRAKQPTWHSWWSKGKVDSVFFPIIPFSRFYRFDPETTTKDEPEPAMWHAWLYDRVATMAELAKHTEPSMEIRNTEVWSHVEKERERGWQKEMMNLLQQQNKLLNHLVKSSGVDPNEILK